MVCPGEGSQTFRSFTDIIEAFTLGLYSLQTTAVPWLAILAFIEEMKRTEADGLEYTFSGESEPIVASSLTGAIFRVRSRFRRFQWPIRYAELGPVQPSRYYRSKSHSFPDFFHVIPPISPPMYGLYSLKCRAGGSLPLTCQMPHVLVFVMEVHQQVLYYFKDSRS